MKTKFYAFPKPRRFAHRGSSGNAPENTIASFELAVEHGADILEMDVHATTDAHLVVMHDPMLDRTTDGAGSITQLTLAELKKLDAGYRFSPDGGKTFPFRGKGITVPTLREVAERFSDTPFNIEVKACETPNERAVVELLGKLGHADITLLAAENDVMMGRVRAVWNGRPTNLSGSEVLQFIQRLNTGDWADYVPPGDALQIPESYDGFPVLTPALLEAGHRFSIEVHIWTVNEEADMRRLLAMGVDGIMTDYPDRLTKVVREIGLRPDLES
jgi:glycerophosphoryl diester phosphodiesterase